MSRHTSCHTCRVLCFTVSNNTVPILPNSTIIDSSKDLNDKCLIYILLLDLFMLLSVVFFQNALHVINV